MLDIAGSLQLLHATHVRERDKALLRSVVVEMCMGEGGRRGEGDETSFRVVCAVGFDGDGHLFWECLHLPLWFKFMKNHELHDWIQKDESTWPGCLLWHGCLRALSGTWCAFWRGCT